VVLVVEQDVLDQVWLLHVLEIVVELVIVSVHLVLVRVFVLCHVELPVVQDNILMNVTVRYVILVVEILVAEETVLVHRALLSVLLADVIRHVLVIVMVYVDKVVQLDQLDVDILLVRPQAERKHKNSFKTR